MQLALTIQMLLSFCIYINAAAVATTDSTLTKTSTFNVTTTASITKTSTFKTTTTETFSRTSTFKITDTTTVTRTAKLTITNSIASTTTITETQLQPTTITVTSVPSTCPTSDTGTSTTTSTSTSTTSDPAPTSLSCTYYLLFIRYFTTTQGYSNEYLSIQTVPRTGARRLVAAPSWDQGSIVILDSTTGYLYVGEQDYGQSAAVFNPNDGTMIFARLTDAQDAGFSLVTCSIENDNSAVTCNSGSAGTMSVDGSAQEVHLSSGSSAFPSIAFQAYRTQCVSAPPNCGLGPGYNQR